MHSWTEMRKMNFKILENFSKEIIDAAKYHWELDRNFLRDESRFKFFRLDEYQDYVVIKGDHPLQKLVKFPIEHFSIIYLRSLPKAGLGPVHIDSNRGCALNIPISVDPNDSFCFTAKSGVKCTERPFYHDEIGNPESKRYLYEPEKYDYYNVRETCLLNTKVTHGFANFAETERVLLSISFKESYEDVVDMLSKDWF